VSNASANNLSREKIQQLLAAVGLEAAEDTTQIETEEYNWHQPHYFSRNQLRELDGFTKKLAAAIAKKFTEFHHSDFNVTIASITQHFAGELLNRPLDSEQNDYHLAFGTDQDQSCGIITVGLQTAVLWVTQLLGDSEPKPDSDKRLSQLEESLLLDIASALVKALSDFYDNTDFHPTAGIARGHLPLKSQGTQELCKITFRIEKANSEGTEAHLLMPCKNMEPVVDKNAQADKEPSTEDISKALLGHVQQVLVPVTARLAFAAPTLEEMMDLQTDDILLLDKKIDEPIELVVEGKTVFRGWPANSIGKYAVAITESNNGK